MRFCNGIVLTLLFPLIEGCAATVNISLLHFQVSSQTIDYGFIAWMIMGAISVVTALNAYEIAMVKLPHKE